MVQTIHKRELTAEDQRIIGQLLVETLSGKITEETWVALSKLRDIPEPYGHLVRYAWGYGLDGKSLAHDLQEELRGICVELLDPNYPPK
ncbi:MAG TPA: hypothetical protein VFZ43_09990 [Anaerolineales bacterium]